MTSQGCDASTRRFLNFVIIKSSSDKKFHIISKLDNVIIDHHANFEVSDVTRGGARSFLRFYSMGRAGWGKKFWCQNFALIILHPAIGAFFLVFPVLGHSGHSTMCFQAKIRDHDSLHFFHLFSTSKVMILQMYSFVM